MTSQALSAVPTSAKDGEPDRLIEIYVRAAQVFHDQGFDATSMDDLAKALQLTKAGLYYYIGSKQDLLFGIMNCGMDWLEREVVKPAQAETDPKRRIEFIIRRHGCELMEGPRAIAILSDEVAALKPKHRRRILERKRAYFDLVRGTLEELKSEGKLTPVNTTVAAFSIFGMLLWLPRWYKPEGRLSSAFIDDEMVKVALGGLVKGKP